MRARRDSVLGGLSLDSIAESCFNQEAGVLGCLRDPLTQARDEGS